MNKSHSSKPWMNKTFEDNAIFEMDVSYVIQHLSPYAQGKLYGDNQDNDFKKWRSNKMKKIIEHLDRGLHPSKFTPIDVLLNEDKEEFHMMDGYSRLAVFNDEEIKTIQVRILKTD